MLLMEQELYRKGVVAVVIENHTLPSKGQTLIFIVRGRKDNE
jgi:conjugal transfer pilus assembly protein TraK